jgi:hypothetical protein
MRIDKYIQKMMGRVVTCLCGCSSFRLLRNGLIECDHCQRRLNGGNARWSFIDESLDAPGLPKLNADGSVG